MVAHICLLQTAIDLINEDFSVTVVANAESVVFEWLNDARHPHSKQI